MQDRQSARKGMRAPRSLGFRSLLIACALSSASQVHAQTIEQLIQSGAVPKDPSPALTRIPILNRVPQGDVEVTVFLSRRKAGTRTPIHKHDYGGIDCLIQGEATLYYDNQKPIKYSAPTCVHMPPGVAMMNVASGSVDTIFYDIFFGKKGFAYWDVTEKGVSNDVINDFDRKGHVH
jgi:quercetin dioxygenase-like cupin family protein